MARTTRKTREEQETPPKRGKSRSFGSLIAMAMMMVIISGLVLYGIMLGKRARGPEDKGVETAKEKVVDPFAGMKYTEDGLATQAYSGSGSSVDFDSDAEMWKKARSVYDEAKALMQESAQLRAEGDVAWRDRTSQAKDLMQEAVERGDVWRSVLVKETGSGSDLVKRLDKTMQKWRTTMIKLRKTSSR